MTVWHYKAEKISEGAGRARYRFYPDHVMAPDVCGEFEFEVETGAFEIVRSADAGRKGLVSTDEHCVRALVHKLRGQGADLPELVFFVA